MRILPSPFDPIVVLIAAVVMLVATLIVAGSARSGHERTIRLLLLYLTYLAFEVVIKRGAHYAWYVYPIKFSLLAVVVLSWIAWRRTAGPHRATPSLTPILAIYLALAALQIFNPHQGNPLVGVLGWLSDFAFVPLYFLAFELFHDVASVRRLLVATAVIGVLSAGGSFVEQWLGPDMLMRDYPLYVRLVYFTEAGLSYRPFGLSPFMETFGMLAMVGLIAAKRAPLLLVAPALAVCALGNLLHSVRIVWVTGLLGLGLFVLLHRTRSAKGLLVVAGCLALAVNLAMDVTEGRIEGSLQSLTRPVTTFQASSRFGGLNALPLIFTTYPFGVGVGESSPGLRLVDASDVITFGVHNYLVELAGQMSVLGPALLLAFCVGLFGIALKGSARAFADERKPSAWRYSAAWPRRSSSAAASAPRRRTSTSG
jgi:hypothetical protein